RGFPLPRLRVPLPKSDAEQVVIAERGLPAGIGKIPAHGGEIELGGVALRIIDVPFAEDAFDLAAGIALAKVDVGRDFSGLPDQARPPDMRTVALINALKPLVVVIAVRIAAMIAVVIREQLAKILAIDSRGLCGAGVFELCDVGGG